MKHVPDSELRMLLEINRAVFELFHQLPVEERIKISVSYNFHIQNRDNRTLINHKLSPVLLAENGNLWLASCMVSLSSHKKAGHIEVRVAGKNEYWVYELENRKWIKFANITLNDREKEILMLASQGFSIVETAGKLFLTIDAVKYHRKSMFEKLNVQNIAEALSVAFNVKML
jgi:DNA-binding CsgD family transcriptional regulator